MRVCRAAEAVLTDSAAVLEWAAELPLAILLCVFFFLYRFDSRFSIRLQKTRQKPAKGTFERMARMPRNQLLDNLFALFQEQPRWGIRVLREKTQQPEAYLKETLSQIAFLHKSGEFNGLWELQENFKSVGVSFDWHRLFFFFSQQMFIIVVV